MWNNENDRDMKTKILSLMILMMLLACGLVDDQPDNTGVKLIYNFTTNTEGWTGDFADYPVGEEEAYELEFGHSFLPAPLQITDGALKLSGINHSDDLFMFVKSEVTGLVPNREYRINVDVEIASDVADDMVGIGGSPGESVYVKAGATQDEPEIIEDEEGWYRMDIDKGNQAQGGEDMVVLGNFANGTDENIYTLKTLSNSSPIRVTSSNEGTLWLLFGTDSGFEGRTTIYINKIEVELY